jgi:hypothetical protein
VSRMDGGPQSVAHTRCDLRGRSRTWRSRKQMAVILTCIHRDFAGCQQSGGVGIFVKAAFDL